MVKKTVLLLIILMPLKAFGQTVLLHETISDYDFKMPKSGPNFRHFSHMFFGFAFFVPQADDKQIDTKPGSTTCMSVGWRYKLKVFEWFAIGASINYNNEIFNLIQNSEKVVPNGIIHDKEKLRFNNLGSDVFLRLNFGKRGNVIGRFVDVGAYANWSFKVKHMYQDNIKDDNNTQAEIQKVVNTRLNYIEKFNYGFKARIGANRMVVTASYRVSDLFTEEYKEEIGDLFLPRFNLGLEIGLHK